jgi:hypothetical protein
LYELINSPSTRKKISSTERPVDVALKDSSPKKLLLAVDVNGDARLRAGEVELSKNVKRISMGKRKCWSNEESESGWWSLEMVLMAFAG